MRRPLRAVLTVFFIAAAIAGASDVAHAALEASCTGLKLQSAVGVPDGATHHYVFKGICVIDNVTDNGSSRIHKYWGEANVTWTAANNTLEETLAIRNADSESSYGQPAGAVISKFKCATDPTITKISCVLLDHRNLTQYKQFSDAPKNQHRPITQGKTTLEAAVALSNNAPPPPSAGQAPPPAAAGNSGKPAATSGSAVSATVRALQGAPSAASATGGPSTNAVAGGPTTSAVPAGATGPLAGSGCTPMATRGHYVCSTRAGFERCERLRLQGEVRQCEASGRR